MEHYRRGKTQRIPAKTRAAVWQRSNYACEMCGFSRGDADPYSQGAKIRLTVGLVNEGLRNGCNEPKNLRTLCTNCSHGLKGIAIPPRPTRIELLSLVRRATVQNQLQLLQWLRAKHSIHT